MGTMQPEQPPEAPWHGTVTEVNGDWITVDLRRAGDMDLMAEVSASQWGLNDVQPGDTLILDTNANTVSRLSPGTWTQEELDEIWRRAREWHETIVKNVD
jgi:hypothetical protein